MRPGGGDEKFFRHHLPPLLLIKIKRRRSRVAPELPDRPGLSQVFFGQLRQRRSNSAAAKLGSRRHPPQLIRRLAFPFIEMKRRAADAFSIGKRREMMAAG